MQSIKKETILTFLVYLSNLIYNSSCLIAARLLLFIDKI